MAKADYMLCSKCDCKVYYDTDIEYVGVGDIEVLCRECAQKYIITIEERNKK